MARTGQRASSACAKPSKRAKPSGPKKKPATMATWSSSNRCGPARNPCSSRTPIIMGGEGPLTLKRIVRYCDAWMPIDPGVAHVAPGGMTFGEQMVALQDLARQAGRDPIPVYVFFGPRDVEALKGYQDAGVTGVVMSLPPSGGEKALRRMDQIAAIREQVR